MQKRGKASFIVIFIFYWLVVLIIEKQINGKESHIIQSTKKK